MRRILLSLALSGCLLLSPVLAAEGEIPGAFPEAHPPQTFRDVEEGDWFVPYVEACAADGLLTGTGGDTFSPDGLVTRAQAVALAARIHQIAGGGEGTLPQAPKDWGVLTLTAADGTALTSTGHFGDGRFRWWTWKNTVEGWLCYELSPEEFAWAEAQDGQPATLSTGGKTYSGVLDYWLPIGSPVLSFLPDTGETGAENQAIRAAFFGTCQAAPGPGHWERDAYYYVQRTGLAAGSGFDFTAAGDETATRLDLARLLAAAAGELLIPINQISSYPDARAEEEETVLTLYNAGILTGVDSAGSFSGGSPLTRAEMAAMAARVARPELRISFSLEASG